MISLLFITIIEYLPVALILFILSYTKKSLRPLNAAWILFIAFAFDQFIRFLPLYFSFRISHWNWIGGILSFLWPWLLIYPLKVLSPTEMGVKLPHSIKSILWGFVSGFILGGWNILDGLLLTELPPKNLATIDSISYQLLIPGLSEELVFRGLYLAILNIYLGTHKMTNKIPFCWGIFLTSLLFIFAHFINFNRLTGHIIWIGSIDLFINIIITTIVFAYLRLKFESVWPGAICHGMINSFPFIAAYYL